MRDSEVVASIVARESEGLATAYDRYAAALYTYCRSIVPDPADAADAVQDTFILAAARIETLRDPDKFRSWLYAIARNECLRLLRDMKHTQATDEVPELTDTGVDLSADAERAEKVTLVQQALDGLNPGEREVIELQLRHELEPAEMADVLGVSRNHVHSLLSRARQQLEAGLAVLLVGRAGREDCHELGQLLADWDGRLTILLRKRVSRHIEHCGTCSGRRALVLAPAALLDLSAAMALAYVAAPAGLKDQVLRLGLGQEAAAAAHRAAVAKSAGAFRDSGFPRSAHGPKGAVHHAPWHTSRSGQAAVAAGVVVAAALAAVAALALTADNSGHHKVSGSGPQSPVFSVAPTPGQPPSAGQPHKKAAPPGGHVAATTPAPTATGRPTAPAGTAPHAATPGPTTAPAGTPGGHPGTPGSPGATTTPAPPGAPTPTPTPTPTSAPTTSAPPPPPQAGTLSADPLGGVLLIGPNGASITLHAVGGPVTWSVGQLGPLIGSVSVSPSSGRLEEGQQVSVTVTASPLAAGDVLSVSPCGHTYVLVVGLGALVSADSPAATSDAPPSAAAGVQPPTVGDPPPPAGAGTAARSVPAVVGRKPGMS